MEWLLTVLEKERQPEEVGEWEFWEGLWSSSRCLQQTQRVSKACLWVQILAEIEEGNDKATLTFIVASSFPSSISARSTHNICWQTWFVPTWSHHLCPAMCCLQDIFFQLAWCLYARGRPKVEVHRQRLDLFKPQGRGAAFWCGFSGFISEIYWILHGSSSPASWDIVMMQLQYIMIHGRRLRGPLSVQ